MFVIVRFTLNINGEPCGSDLRLEIKFEEARVGILKCTCYEGRDLTNMELVGKQDPCVAPLPPYLYPNQSTMIFFGIPV